MRVRIAFFFLVFVSSSIGTPAFAWNNIGHMTVAYAAWQGLDAPMRTQVSALVAQNPKFSVWSNLVPASVTGEKRDMYLFMIAATWPDQIKGDPGDFPCNHHGNGDTPPAGELPSLNTGYSDTCMHKYWHFVDNSYDPDDTPPHQVPTPNGLQKIDAFAAALHTDESKSLKSYDLVWLEHLVGDMHQPLHCVTRYTAAHTDGDQGGNKVAIVGDGSELHAYWDDILGNKTRSFYSDAKLAEVVGQTLPAPDATLAADTKTADWIQESVVDAEDYTYVDPIGPDWGPYTITAAYHATAVNIAQARVSLAGLRLASLIKTALGS